MRPRREQVDLSVQSTYHCVSRVVRRAFLLDACCDSELLKRKPWIEKRLRRLASIFAIALDTFAILDNHLHLILTVLPQVSAAWSAHEVARRWLTLFPPVRRLGIRGSATDQEIALLASDAERVARLRARLCDLGEFHKALKEPLSRLVNREEGVTGHFWEGRYSSKRVLDRAALLATMAYVDLNAIRAGTADSPESSRFTGIWHRLQAWKTAMARRSALHVATGNRRARSRRSSSDSKAHRQEPPTLALALTPIQNQRDRRGLFDDLTEEQYFAFVDQAGRATRAGKSGRIPRDLAPILSRLEVDSRTFIDQVAAPMRRIGSVIGRPASCMAEATRCNRRWVVSAIRLSRVDSRTE